MRNVTRPWQGGAATGRLERLSQTSGPEQKRTCRPWCGRPSMLWGKLPSLSTPLGARAGSREPARAYPGCAEPARRDNAVCVNAGELAKGSSRGVRRARSSGDAPGNRGGAKGPWSTGAGASALHQGRRLARAYTTFGGLVRPRRRRTRKRTEGDGNA